MDCSPPGSSVHGILQVRMLEWVAIPFSRESSWARNQTRVSCIASQFFTTWATREAPSWFRQFSNSASVTFQIFAIFLLCYPATLMVPTYPLRWAFLLVPRQLLLLKTSHKMITLQRVGSDPFGFFFLWKAPQQPFHLFQRFFSPWHHIPEIFSPDITLARLSFAFIT